MQFQSPPTNNSMAMWSNFRCCCRLLLASHLQSCRVVESLIFFFEPAFLHLPLMLHSQLATNWLVELGAKSEMGEGRNEDSALR